MYGTPLLSVSEEEIKRLFQSNGKRQGSCIQMKLSLVAFAYELE